MKFNRFIEANYPADTEKLKALYNELIINFCFLTNNYEEQINNNDMMRVFVDDVNETIKLFRFVNSYRRMFLAERELPMYLAGVNGIINDFQNI